MSQAKPNKPRQQYGVVPEKVPEPFNKINELIDLNDVFNLNPILKILLFRDIGDGDCLVTQEIANQMKKDLEQLARVSEEKFQAGLYSSLNALYREPKLPYTAPQLGISYH